MPPTQRPAPPQADVETPPAGQRFQRSGAGEAPAPARRYDDEPRSMIRWGAVTGGVITVVAALGILTSLGTAVGWSILDTTAAEFADVSTAEWVWGIVSAIIAFFAGGLVAAATAPGSRVRGAMHGLMVGAAAIAVALLVTSFGGGVLLGAGTAALGNIVDVDEQIRDEVLLAGTVEQAENNAWGVFAGYSLAVVFAGIGGMLGPRGHDDR